jgi:hypothetical protein
MMKSALFILCRGDNAYLVVLVEWPAAMVTLASDLLTALAPRSPIDVREAVRIGRKAKRLDQVVSIEGCHDSAFSLVPCHDGMCYAARAHHHAWLVFVVGQHLKTSSTRDSKAARVVQASLARERLFRNLLMVSINLSFDISRMRVRQLTG